MDFYLTWVGVGTVAAVVVWILTTCVKSGMMRLAIRSLTIAAVVTPQPLWAPGDGGLVVPAGMLLLSFHSPVFAVMNGAIPIMGVSGILFVIAGYIFSIRTSESSARIHTCIQIWVLNGIILPFMVLVISIPFLAFFLFGGVLAYWSIFVLICMLGAMTVDRRIVKGDPEPSHTTYFHRVSLVLFGTGAGAIISAIIIRIM